MASEDDHLAMARGNHEALLHLWSGKERFGGWVATVAFYKAVHLVEAMLARSGQHGCDHKHREEFLKQKKFQHIYLHYRPLKSASMIARYLADFAGPVYRSFIDYMPVEKVKSELLDYRLHEVEKSAAKSLAPKFQPQKIS